MRFALLTFPKYEAELNNTMSEANLLHTAFASRGIELDIISGINVSVDWSRYNAALPLGCWGYHRDPIAWRDWLTMIAEHVQLINDVRILHWNTDKSYLIDLETNGIDVAPFLHFPVLSSPDLREELARVGWHRYVIKPTISANAQRTVVAEGEPSTELLALSKEILAGAGLLVQPFFEEIPEQGEWSLIFFGGLFSHAVLKRPKFGDFRSQPDHGAHVSPVEPTTQIVAQAAAALAIAPRSPAYARVDGFLRGGRFNLIELELIEPRLFLETTNSLAAEKFCDSVLAHVDPLL